MAISRRTFNVVNQIRSKERIVVQGFLRSGPMQVLCKASTMASDIQCSVCGQNFQVFWERTNSTEREAAREEILAALKAQHTSNRGPDAHGACFNLPEWNGSPKYSGAALLGNAPATTFQAA
jgi:hypothetical protein